MTAWPALRHYLIASGLVLASVGLRFILDPLLGDRAPYLVFFPAILVASWLGGFGPGVLATSLSAFVAMRWLLAASGAESLSTADAITLTLFAATGVAIASLNGRLRVAHHESRAEAALARTRAERLGAIINTTVDGIIVIDDRGTIESFNPGAERLFGYSASAVIGKNVNVLMPEPFHSEHDVYLKRYLETGRAAIIGIGRQVAGRRADGTTFPVHLSVGEMRLEGKRKFTGMLHDLSDRERLEERLREQTALARLGEMAAMIAHEVKNPLAGIRGAVQVIGSRMPKDNPDAAIMAEIVRRVDSLDAMMKDLLVFARPPQPKRSPTELAPLLHATAGLLKEDDGAKEVEVQIGGTVPPIPVDGEMLKMVFHNLLINSAHAMNGSGRIRVQLESAEGVCRIAIKDEGPGIPAEARDKIFSPFFTTKRRGSGLGLPTAKRFIEAHNGSISIQSPPNGGTTVIVQLPLQESP